MKRRGIAAAVIVLGGTAFFLVNLRDRLPAGSASPPAYGAWPAYGGDEQGRRYSSLDEINARNVRGLRPAWEATFGDFGNEGNGQKTPRKTSFEATPILVEDKLVYCTPLLRVVAVNPENGRKIWSYDGAMYRGRISPTKVCRGVSMWRNLSLKAGEACATQIIFGNMSAKLIALDAATGRPCEKFGTAGMVDLKEGLGKVNEGEYYLTSPPAIYQNLAIVGSRVVDDQNTEVPSGVIRAYDLASGRLVWSWDPVPADYLDRSAWKARDPKSYGQFVRGSPNSWSLMSVDSARGVVYVPTGSPGADYFRGSFRPGIDYYGSSVVALNAGTGKPIWNFKLVRHDVWDYDASAQPVLFSRRGADGREVPALIAASKVGHVFILDRTTGRPVFGTREIRAPADSDAGDTLSPSQIEPELPRPLHPYGFSIEDAALPVRRACRERLAKLRFDGAFTPPSQKGSLQFPGPLGGINWGSVSIDEKNQILVANFSILGLEVRLVPREQFASGGNKFDGMFGRENMLGTPYGLYRTAFAAGIPCVPPPWGKIVAINLSNGRLLWEKPLGRKNGIAGLPNQGGSLITAGNLVFIGASTDAKFRALDLFSGEEVWSYPLKFGGQATPMTYRYRGRQYVVIADGGNGFLSANAGDRLIAFRLPRDAGGI